MGMSSAEALALLETAERGDEVVDGIKPKDVEEVVRYVAAAPLVAGDGGSHTELPAAVG